jgi:hypothetical protein
MFLILAVGVIALVLSIILGEPDTIKEFFDIPATDISNLRELLRPYVAGIPFPEPI